MGKGKKLEATLCIALGESMLCDGHQFCTFLWDWECQKMGCWRPVSMGLALKEPIVFEKLMLECANPWQPIVLVD